ncbi:MAG: DUF2073 domain-containing protein [Candidatus Heimdallarchaeota archaeon]
MNLQLDIVRRSTTAKLSTEEKCGLILEHISEGRIVLIEDGLSPAEVAILIASTMELIGHNVESEFRGVEILSPNPPVIAHSFSKRSIFRRSDHWKGQLPIVVAPADVDMTVSVS